ncbi:V-type ATP synthase subunit E [Kallipyga massiliensis]|uniref:V-type ATP synthase subunit E n=1 Tax=Kallipyga massiliensis TaxID=1472764 RepID=UPI0026E972EB|nr:V-type ATP synthase subunit E [Kallipyga massiliensis]
MSNLNNIINSIIEDANQEANRIIEDARTKAQAEKQECMDRLAREDQAFDARKSVLEAQIRDRVQTGAEREARNLVLTAKQEAVDRAFNLAKEELTKMGGVQYKKVLDRFLKKVTKSPDLVVEIPKNRNYESSEFTVIKVDDLRSGFRINRGGIRENFDFDQVVDGLRSSLDTEVVQLIAER